MLSHVKISFRRFVSANAVRSERCSRSKKPVNVTHVELSLDFCSAASMNLKITVCTVVYVLKCTRLAFTAIVF